MRIGIDASRAFVDQPTGTERYSFEMITHLLTLPEARKHEWILYTKFPITNFQFPINSLKIQVIPLLRLWTQVGLAARTWVDKLDVLWVPAHTLPVFRKPGVKTVVTIHGIEYEWLPAYESKLQRWYLPLSTKYAVATADKIIAVSGFTKLQLVERLGADAKKIEVIWEGVNNNYQFHMSNNQSILKRYHLQSKKYLIFVGTVQPRKNLERLIEAFARSKFQETRYKDLKLVIAGKLGWNFKAVVDAPKKYEIEDRVIITGYISEQEREVLLKNALVYIQPSITEGFGLPILEAWQAGLPVVSSKGGALAEVVGEAGILVDPVNIDDISKAILNLIKNPKLRKEIGRKGSERLKLFNWDLAAKQTIKVISNLE